MSRRLVRGAEFFCEFGDTISETRIGRDTHVHQRYGKTSRRQRLVQELCQR